MSLYDKVFPPKKMTISNGKTIEKPASRLPLVAVILLIMTAISVKITGFDLRGSGREGKSVFRHTGHDDPAEGFLYVTDLETAF